MHTDSNLTSFNLAFEIAEMARVRNRTLMVHWLLATALATSSAAISPLLAPLLLGLFQGIVLQKYIPQNGVWPLVTTVGNYISLFVVTVLLFSTALVGRDSDTAFGVITLSLFALIGLTTLVLRSGFQCWVLSRYCETCLWWLMAGTVGTVTGCSVAFILQYAIYFSNPDFTSLRQGDLPILFLIWGLGGSVMGAIESVALSEILSQRRA